MHRPRSSVLDYSEIIQRLLSRRGDDLNAMTARRERGPKSRDVRAHASRPAQVVWTHEGDVHATQTLTFPFHEVMARVDRSGGLDRGDRACRPPPAPCGSGADLRSARAR